MSFVQNKTTLWFHHNKGAPLFRRGIVIQPFIVLKGTGHKDLLGNEQWGLAIL